MWIIYSGNQWIFSPLFGFLSKLIIIVIVVLIFPFASFLSYKKKKSKRMKKCNLRLNFLSILDYHVRRTTSLVPPFLLFSLLSLIKWTDTIGRTNCWSISFHSYDDMFAGSILRYGIGCFHLLCFPALYHVLFRLFI